MTSDGFAAQAGIAAAVHGFVGGRHVMHFDAAHRTGSPYSVAGRASGITITAS